MALSHGSVTAGVHIYIPPLLFDFSLNTQFIMGSEISSIPTTQFCVLMGGEKTAESDSIL